MREQDYLFAEIVRGNFPREAFAWIVESFRTYDRHKGVIPMERCLGLAQHGDRRRWLRDYLVREVAAMLEGPPSQRARLLEREFDRFSGGTWREWKGMKNPPPHADPFRCALFRLALHLGDEALPGCKRLQQILEMEADGDFQEPAAE